MTDTDSKHRVPTALALAAALAGAIAIPLFGAGCGENEESAALVANAGENRTLLVGRPVYLDGSRSTYTGGEPMAYQWRVAERPPASRAVLAATMDMRPSFTPDLPGTYLIELAVSAGSSVSAADQVMVTADYAPADFVYLDSRVVSGDPAIIDSYNISMGLSPSISPGANLYPAPAFTGYTGSPVGFHVMVLNRADGTVRSHKSYPITNLTQANTLATDLASLTKDHLVIVSSLQYPAVKKITDLCGSTDPNTCKLLGALEKVGASTQVGSVGSTAMQSAESYSLVGIGAVGAGNGFERWSGNVPGNADVAGILVRDSLQQFGFTYQYVPFETRTSADSSTAAPDSIVIGDAIYSLPSALPDANSGGFHVLVLDRSTLAPISHKLYLVNHSGTRDSTQVKAMGNDLYAIAKTFDKLVIVTGVGVLPTMRSFKTDAQKVEWAVDLLGGTPGVIPKLTAGNTYSLVGIGPGTAYPKDHWRLPEANYPIVSVAASSVETPGLEANIRGFLKKDRQGWFVPVLSNPGGSTVGIDYSLLSIALQEPVPWRGPDTEAEKDAYAMISRYVFRSVNVTHPDDMRLYYYLHLSWESLYTILDTLTCDQVYGAPCAPDTKQAFDTMRARLDEEVLDRNHLEKWFNNDVTQLLQGLETTQVIDLATAYQNAMSLAQVDPKHEALMKVLQVVGDLASFVCSVAAFATPAPAPQDITAADVSAPAGLLSALIVLGMDFIPSPTNNAPGEVQAAAGELWMKVLQSYINTTATTNQAFLYITEDWGRMEAFHAVYLSLYDYTRYNTVLEGLAPGITASFYRSLLPITFKLLPMPLTTSYLNYDCNTVNPCDYYACRSSGRINYYESNSCLFSSSKGVYRPDDAVETVENLSYSSTPCTTSTPRHSYYTIWKGGGTNSSDYYTDAQIKLFPAPADGGLGVSRLNFYTRWPFSYASNGHWNDGCNCSPNTHLCPDNW